MSINRILIQGYYGFGNLGDDILLKVTLGIMRTFFPDASYTVFVNTNPQRAAYLSAWLGEELPYIDYRARQHFDLIVHGGGGVHYDYNPGGIGYALLNPLIRLSPAAYSLLYGLYKKIKGKEHITAAHRIGLGIGMGTFTSSSAKYYFNAPILAGYQYLMVRDSRSVKLANDLCAQAHVSLGTDLAFSTEHWKPGQPAGIRENTKPQIGIVLRDWPDAFYLSVMSDVAEMIRQAGMDVTCFSFEKHYDQRYQQILGSRFPLWSWPDEAGNVKAFFDHFAIQDLIITSRFHGAILASAYSIPSIALALEPKLNTLRELLPLSCTLIELADLPRNLTDRVNEILKQPEAGKKNARLDFERNNNVIRQKIDELKTFFQQQAWS
jgi:polysaccharide pyruvyl transferase WcaK-like protein